MVIVQARQQWYYRSLPWCPGYISATFSFPIIAIRWNNLVILQSCRDQVHKVCLNLYYRNPWKTIQHIKKHGPINTSTSLKNCLHNIRRSTGNTWTEQNGRDNKIYLKNCLHNIRRILGIVKENNKVHEWRENSFCPIQAHTSRL